MGFLGHGPVRRDPLRPSGGLRQEEPFAVVQVARKGDHPEGVIKECASILRNSVRSSDFLCRYGGDEFVIVTPKAECRKNEELIGRIHKHLDEWNREFATFDYQLSFSMGCANWKEGRLLSDVFHEADLRMYEDKKRKKE